VLALRFLVTGAAGFIGSNLVDRLLAEGHDVVGVDDLSRGKLENLEEARRVGGSGDSKFSFVKADITAAGFGDIVASSNPEVVCHLAAQMDVRVSVREPLEDARLNVLGTINVLEASRAAGVRKVVFTSSGGSIYGDPEHLPVSERAGLDPHSPYAASKVCGEVYLGTYRHLYGLQSTSLALGNVYGPRQDPHGEAGVVAIFCSALLAGRQGTIYGDGTAVRDYVYVDDVVDAFVRAAGDAGNGRRFNIGTGVGTSVREVHAGIATAAGMPDEPTFAEARLGELQAITLDVSSARHGIGWEPFTTLAQGLVRTLDWVRGEGVGGRG
jgi:UDP-glucose 4-epimerase